MSFRLVGTPARITTPPRLMGGREQAPAIDVCLDVIGKLHVEARLDGPCRISFCADTDRGSRVHLNLPDARMVLDLPITLASLLAQLEEAQAS